MTGPGKDRHQPADVKEMYRTSAPPTDAADEAKHMLGLDSAQALEIRTALANQIVGIIKQMWMPQKAESVQEFSGRVPGVITAAIDEGVIPNAAYEVRALSTPPPVDGTLFDQPPGRYEHQTTIGNFCVAVIPNPAGDGHYQIGVYQNPEITKPLSVDPNATVELGQ